MNQAFAEARKLLKGIVPSADMFAGGIVTDVVNSKGYEKVVFIVDANCEGATGVGTITINATAANTTSSPTAVAFKYSIVGSGVEDGQGALTAATTAGFATTAAVHRVYIIEVDPRDLPDDKPFVHLAAAETVNSPVVGSISILMENPRYSAPNMPVALS